MKVCTRCNKAKPLSDYYKDKRCKDGCRSECKICVIRITKEYNQTEQGRKVHHKAVFRYDQSEKGKAAQKRRRQTEKYKATQKRYRERYQIRCPERLKAKDAVNYAIRVGKLARPNSLLCHYCPKPAQQYHHWQGYDPKHWLDVIPVCIGCHQKCKKKIA